MEQCVVNLIINLIISSSPAVLTRSSIAVAHITAPPGFTLVLLVFPSLRGSPEESFTGVTTDTTVMHVSHS